MGGAVINRPPIIIQFILRKIPVPLSSQTKVLVANSLQTELLAVGRFILRLRGLLPTSQWFFWFI